MGDDSDFFFYQANTSAIHREQIVIHEFGHLIAGHQVIGMPGAVTPGTDRGFDDASDEALRRTCYSDDREWEAEVLATLIGEWADRAAASLGATATDRGLRGLQRLFGGHDGWL
ncbi:hypothetical protein GCM10027169_20110 [Gordonia jinhuaensis]|uniref:IrrE N-terminal-like domain-containing protein n=1 Tax=Gordonia jinhuaensis TaxID=1517702 RepID=A0A916TGD9_9ACTN|nr:hypothetical protein [Gordonia jinhuaensis]GGB44406.1 hypothetical protein GCM10011489_34850 [Gordonia jinhuaensis]